MLKTQPNEHRCERTTVTHVLSIPPCCPVSGNPLEGSTAWISYTPKLHLLEVEALRHYIDSYKGGRGEVRSMEGMIQNIAQDCADLIRSEVTVRADLNILPSQNMTVECVGYPCRGGVYLCGGINGLSDGECKDWREMAKYMLRGATIDPMRRDYRGMEGDNVAAIVEGDLSDIDTVEVVLVNATRPSWGTAMEIVYAHLRRKTIICFTGESVVSPWLRFHSTKIFVSLDEACQYINSLQTS